MTKGWYNESRRHALARAGVKTAVQGKPITKIPTMKVSVINKYLANKFLSDRAIEKRDDGYYDLDTGKKIPNENILGVAEFNIEQSKKKRKELLGLLKSAPKTVSWSKAEKDSDGDGMPDNLDCDPNDPNKQGFFDNMKQRVIDVVKGEPQEVKTKRLRAELEAREERLEAQKEQKLLQLSSKTEELRGIQEIKAKEKELDRIQDELEEGTFKQRLKTGLKSGAQQAFILAKKGVKRVREELSEKTPKKYTSVTLTEQERTRTSTTTRRRLEKQEKTNAELEAKITLRKLKREEKELKKQLKSTRTKRKKKKKESFL